MGNTIHKKSDLLLEHHYKAKKILEQLQSELNIVNNNTFTKKDEVFERYAVVYVMYKYLNFKPGAIAILLANNNHTMISYIVRKASDWMDVESDFVKLVEKIKLTLNIEEK